MPKLAFDLDVVMQRSPVNSPWADHQWAAYEVVASAGSAPPSEFALEGTSTLRVTYRSLVAEVFNDEAEGYYLNLNSPAPCVFVCWREQDDSGFAIPHMLTLSYNEAARWMDAQEHVDPVDMPAGIKAALAAWVNANYTPPMKKHRVRPNSFRSKDGKFDGGLERPRGDVSVPTAAPAGAAPATAESRHVRR